MCSDPKLLAIVRSKCMGVRACELQIHSCNHIPNQCHQGFEVFLSRMCCSDQTVLVALGTIFVHFRFKEHNETSISMLFLFNCFS